MSERIRQLGPSAVEIRDEFWTPRLETNRLVTLGHQYDHIKANSCLDNFRRVVGEAGGEFEGPMFLDANAYKWLEAACHVLASHDMPSLRKKVDEVVSLIKRTQADDGYLYTYFLLAEQDKRWTNFSLMHELYCAGHLIEAGVAHHRATGEQTLLDVATDFADHINERFGPGNQEVIPGHEEIELALVELYRETGEQRYLDLAKCFIDRRGQEPSPLADELFRLDELGGAEIYDEVLQSTEAARGVFLDESGEYDGRFAQDHAPVREHETIEGHAVRATYLYAAAAALLDHVNDPALFAAVERLWQNLRTRRLYITGGLGSTSEGESFTEDYDLPNNTAYAETCAAVGGVFWCQRMFELTGEARYVDLIERILYNALLVGVSLDGRQFSYANPLEVRDGRERQEWLYVACCPPNLARLLASLERYVYATASSTLYVNLYVGSDATATLDGRSVRLEQRTDYPWDGETTFEVSINGPAEFALALRMPEWADDVTVTVNGQSVDTDHKDGYAVVRRTWTDGDSVSISFPLSIDVLAAHPEVRDDEAHVAIRRGPIVYCIEAADHEAPVHHLILDDPGSLSAQHDPDLLDGVTVIKGKAAVEDSDDWERELYRPIEAVETEHVEFTAIPYYAWGNREPGPMRVWLRAA